MSTPDAEPSKALIPYGEANALPEWPKPAPPVIYLVDEGTLMVRRHTAGMLNPFNLPQTSPEERRRIELDALMALLQKDQARQLDELLQFGRKLYDAITVSFESLATALAPVIPTLEELGQALRDAGWGDDGLLPQERVLARKQRPFMCFKHGPSKGGYCPKCH